MLSPIFSPISSCPDSRSAASAAATRVTGSGDSISRVVKGMTEEVTTFRVRFTLASGTLFRKRFLGSARLQRAGCTILPQRTFHYHYLAISGLHHKVRDGRMPSPAATGVLSPEVALALGS